MAESRLSGPESAQEVLSRLLHPAPLASPWAKSLVCRHFSCLWPQRLKGIFQLHLLLARHFSEGFGKMGEMLLASSGPSPSMCLWRQEGVVSKEDPGESRGSRGGHHLLSLGEGQPPPKPRPAGSMWGWLHPWSVGPEPRCGSQASYRGGAAGGVLAAFPVVPASSHHSLLASASGRPCRSWFLPQADPAAQLHLQDSAKGLGSHPCPVSLPHPSFSLVALLPWNLQWLFPSVFRLDCTSLGGCVCVCVCPLALQVETK